jgi:hypothetical protein
MMRIETHSVENKSVRWAMEKREILEAFLKTHQVPDLVKNKLITSSFLTEHFAYGALRIGNSIGNALDIAIETILLEEIAARYNLILNTTEHAELHTKGSSAKDLEQLIQGAVHFENIVNNKKQYKKILASVNDAIRKAAQQMLTT